MGVWWVKVGVEVVFWKWDWKIKIGWPFWGFLWYHRRPFQNEWLGLLKINFKIKVTFYNLGDSFITALSEYQGPTFSLFRTHIFKLFWTSTFKDPYFSLTFYFQRSRLHFFRGWFFLSGRPFIDFAQTPKFFAKSIFYQKAQGKSSKPKLTPSNTFTTPPTSFTL